MSYMDFYSESCHKSRKERTCECCGKEIHIGDYYVNQRGKWEREFFSRNLCLTCEKAILAFCSNVDNEFDYDEIHYYTVERVCEKCDKHYNDTCEEECTMWCPKVIKFWEEWDGAE